MFSTELITRIKQARQVGVLTGAGISAESGVPTFRGEDGIWKKLNPVELASMDAFLRNPDLVWEWYSFRRKLIRQVQPNPGHLALAELERKKSDFTLITQNIDNLHRLAGSQNICELHGNIMRNRCVDCNKIIPDLEYDAAQKVPHCECGGLIRPDVVWFGELLPEPELRKARQVARTCDVFLSVGTSAQVQPAASLPLEAHDAGAYVVEINLEPTFISDYVNVVILGQAGAILPQLVSLI